MFLKNCVPLFSIQFEITHVPLMNLLLITSSISVCGCQDNSCISYILCNLISKSPDERVLQINKYEMYFPFTIKKYLSTTIKDFRRSQ